LRLSRLAEKYTAGQSRADEGQGRAADPTPDRRSQRFTRMILIINANNIKAEPSAA
jgi:hypothetical protein